MRQPISTNSASVPPSAGCGSRSRPFLGRHIHDYRDAWEVVRRAGHPAVGLVLDCFTCSCGTDLSAIRAIPKDRIFLVQMADAPKLDMDYLSWSRHYRCFPGQGERQSTSSCWPCRPRGSTACSRSRSSTIVAPARPSVGAVDAAFPHRHARRTPPENRSQHRRPAESAAEGHPRASSSSSSPSTRALSLSSKPLPASASARPASIVPRG